MLEKFLPRQHFDSYEDFKANYRVNILDNFNFAYDVVDDWAETRPEKTALVWCNDHGEERIFSFGQLKQLSNQAANFFKCYGIRKGDPSSCCSNAAGIIGSACWAFTNWAPLPSLRPSN